MAAFIVFSVPGAKVGSSTYSGSGGSISSTFSEARYRHAENRNSCLAVSVACKNTDRFVRSIYKTEVRLFPADGSILARSYIVRLESMGAAEGNFHAGLKYYPV